MNVFAFFKGGLEEKIEINEEIVKDAISSLNLLNQNEFTTQMVLEKIYKKKGVDEEYARKHVSEDIPKVVEILNNLVEKGYLSRMSVHYKRNSCYQGDLTNEKAYATL